MSLEEYLALGLTGIIALVAIWYAFRDNYTDIANRPDPPYAGDGKLDLRIPLINKPGAERSDGYWKARADGHEDFARGLDEFSRKNADFSFHTRLIGVNHSNRDRTRRGPAIKKCAPFDILILEPEPDNPEDPLAIAVKLSVTRFQIGYLEWLTARDIRRDTESGRLWIALFKRCWCSESGKVIGAEIVLVRLKADVERVEQKDVLDKP